MGFYGNITNTSKTQFQFDKIYPNRYEMDNAKTYDGIYAGRYVLVEYDSETNLDTFVRAQFRNGGFYYNPTGEPQYNTKITKGIMGKGQIIYVSDVDKTPAEGLHAKNCIFYVCTSEFIEGSDEFAEFAETVNGANVPSYTVNYNIDTDKYGSGRGYDSTVWQKVYMDGVEKYIMIAELNTVVPTFDVVPDAPTMAPLVPHFDTQSTDVYYKLHWQPQWGFRIKEAAATNASSTDITPYPSDQVVEYRFSKYNPDTGRDEEQDPITFDGAIYYNKAGFEVEKHNRYEGFENEISVMPSGRSGTLYNKHDGTSDKLNSPDIQELKILLPVLGNTVSDIFDIVYGYNKKVLADGTVLTTSDDVRFRDYGWKDAVWQVGVGDDGLPIYGQQPENPELGGMTRDVNTFVGCINTIHDLMGMIITEKLDVYLNEEWFNKNLIYNDLVTHKYYRIHKYPTYTTISVDSIQLDRNDYPSDQEYNAAYREALGELLQDKEYYLILDSTSDNYKVKAFNEKALSALTADSIIGYPSGFGYEYTEIPGMGLNLSTIYGCILQMKNLLEVDNSETRNLATVTGAINQLNDIIEVFEDLVPGEFLICDENGHVNSANWTTAQDFVYSNFGNPNSVLKPIFDTQENRWLNLSLDPTSKLISLTHNFNKIEDTITVSDKNNEGNGINAGQSDDLILYTPIVDATGHVVGKNLESVTLPYSFKTFKTDGYNNIDDKDLYTEIAPGTASDPEVEFKSPPDVKDVIADNSKDELKILLGNKWIQTATNADNDVIILAHEIHAFDETTRATNLNIDNVPSSLDSDKITIQDTEYDRAGHLLVNRDHTYTLPYGFKTVKTNGSSTIEEDLYTSVSNRDSTITSASETKSAPVRNDIIAESTQDDVTINTGNKWIQVRTNNLTDALTLAHEVHAIDTKSEVTDFNILSPGNPINTLVIQEVKHDNAGHLIQNKARTYTMPFNFKFVTSGGENSSTLNPTINNTIIKADNTQDNLTITPSNKWVRMSADDSNNILSIGHEVNPITTTDINSITEPDDLDKKQIFVVQDLKFDSAGHVTHNQNHAYKLPDSFKQVAIGEASMIETNGIHNSGVIEADSQVDVLTVNAQNRWITLSANTGNDSYAIGHAGPGAQKASSQTGAETPNFGATFKIPEIKYDALGHISGTTTHDVTIPAPSLNAAPAGNVMTGLTLNTTTGSFTQSKANIGTLALTGYTLGSDATAIAATDTINAAFSKLQVQINNLTAQLSAANGEIMTLKNRVSKLENPTTP